MKKSKRLFSAVVLLLILAFSLPMSVSANSPMPANHLTVVFSDVPKDVVYVDLLIQISEDDANYVDFQPNSFAEEFFMVKDIAGYSTDGYRSFTFHYKNAKSDIKIKPYYSGYYSVDFCKGPEYREYLTQYEDLRNNYRDIKIALLDRYFNIILVSKEMQLPKVSNAINFDGRVDYDIPTNSLSLDTRVNPYFVLFGGFFSILIMLLSIGTEVVVSLLFKFRGKQVSTVLVVNICSQIIMRVLYLLLPFAYLIETIILEVLVYGAEFWIYRKKFNEVGTAKIICYTVVANTLSLLLGIFLDCYLLA